MNQPQDDTPDAQLARLERDIAPGLLLSVLKGEFLTLTLAKQELERSLREAQTELTAERAKHVMEPWDLVESLKKDREAALSQWKAERAAKEKAEQQLAERPSSQQVDAIIDECARRVEDAASAGADTRAIANFVRAYKNEWPFTIAKGKL